MKVNVASAVKNIVNWAFPLFFLGGLLYLVYDDYRDNGTATEEQLLMISKYPVPVRIFERHSVIARDH